MLKKIKDYGLSMLTVMFFVSFALGGANIIGNHVTTIIAGLCTLGCGWLALKYELK